MAVVGGAAYAVVAVAEGIYIDVIAGPKVVAGARPYVVGGAPKVVVGAVAYIDCAATIEVIAGTLADMAAVSFVGELFQIFHVIKERGANSGQLLAGLSEVRYCLVLGIFCLFEFLLRRFDMVSDLLFLHVEMLHTLNFFCVHFVFGALEIVQQVLQSLNDTR